MSKHPPEEKPDRRDFYDCGDEPPDTPFLQECVARVRRMQADHAAAEPALAKDGVPE